MRGLPVHIHVIFLLHPPAFPLILLALPLLGKDGFQVLGTSVDILRVARVFEGSRVLQVGKLLRETL